MGITAKLDIDEVISGLEGLIETLSNVPDSLTTAINVEGVEDLTEAANDAEVSIEQIGEAAAMSSGDISNMDTSGLEDIESSADSASISLEDIGISASESDISMQALGEAAAHANADISNIDSSPLQEVAGSAKDANQAVGGAAENMGVLEMAMSAVIGTGIVAYLGKAADAAGDFGDRWSRMSIIFGGTSGSMDQFKGEWNGAIDEMREKTGRGLGTIQEELIQLGISGVQNKDILIDSFNAINGTAFLLNGGKNIEGIEASYNRLVKSQTMGSRQLLQLGIDQNDVLKGTGMTITELKDKWSSYSTEERATILNSILNAGGAAEANEKWKDSYEHLKEAATLAFGGLARAVGTLILPYVIPAIELVTNVVKWFTNGLKGLNPTIKTVVGAVAFFAGGLGSLYLILSPFFGILSSIFGVLGTIGTEMLGLTSGVTVFGVALGPLGWAILAIVAAVTAAIYIWQTWSKELIAFKDALFSGDWGSAASMIGNAFNYVGTTIWNALKSAGTYVWNFLTSIPSMVGNASSTLIDLGMKLTKWIIEGLTSLATYLDDILNDMLTEAVTTAGTSGASSGKESGKKTGKGLIEGFMEWLKNNGPKLITHAQNVFMKLLPLLVRLTVTILTIVGTYMWNESRKAAKKLVDGLISSVTSLPGRIWTWLVATVKKIPLFANAAYAYAKQAGNRIVSGIIDRIRSAPGEMYKWGMRTLNQFIQGIYNSIPGLKQALDIVRKYLPNSPPKMGPLSKTTEKTWFNWTKSLVDAGIEGLNTFTMPDLSAMPNPAGINITGNAVGSTDVNVTLSAVIDLKNAPEGVTNEGVGDYVTKTWLETREGRNALDKTMGRLGYITKSNSGR